jgi:hypothetical protein
MGKALARSMTATAFAAFIASTPVAGEGRDEPVTGDKGSDMLIDLVVLRPIGAVVTVIGAAAFVISLPFTVPTGTVGEAGREMVGKPAEYTFNRPLGELHHCGADRHPCGER